MGRLLVVLVSLLLFASSFTISTSTASNISQAPVTKATGCPAYQTNLMVIRVDSRPAEPVPVQVGQLIVTVFHIVYADNSPVILNPQTASFLWTGSSGEKEFDNVPVTALPNQPGYYSYTATLTSDIVKATGQGLITIWVLKCSCSDAVTNHGPTGNVDSIVTLDTSDNSQITSNPTTTVPAPPGIAMTPQPAPTATTPTPPNPIITSLDVLLLIIALLVVSLLLFVMRIRGRPTGSKP